MSREVPALIEHTFLDTGKTVQIRKLSLFLQDDADAALRKRDRAEGTYPTPPMVTGVEGKLEPNESDPDYIVARATYERKFVTRKQELVMKMAIRRGVELEITDEVKEEIRKLKEDLAADGIELDDSLGDKEIYITRICIGSGEDTQEFYNALFKRALPTREAVEAHKDMFPGND